MQLSLHQQLNSLPYNCQCGRAPLQSSLATATPTDHVPWPDWFKNASYGPVLIDNDIMMKSYEQGLITKKVIAMDTI